MKKVIMIFALATGMVANVFAQQTLSNAYTPGIPFTTPTGFSQLEVSGGAITQNSYLGTGPGTGQESGNFGTNARWNTMGNIPAGSQVLNGFRTQTDGRALAWGHSVPLISGIVSNSFIEWIGNSGSSVAPGNLEFRYATSPISATRFPIFTMAPSRTVLGVAIPSFNYAETDAFVGQLQRGTFGSFGLNDTWSATGQVSPPSSGLVIYGNRHQYEGYTVNTGLFRNNNAGTIDAIMDFGNDVLGQGTYNFKFRSFTDPNSSLSIKNVWQTSNKLNNMVLGVQDYATVNNINFQLSVFDGLVSNASTTATSFVEKAGLYVTGDGVDQNKANLRLNSYAAVVGDVSGVTLNGGSTQKYAILGIADGSYSSGNSFTNNAAYFIGNVSYTGALTFVSDQKFKKDVNTEENILPKLIQLQPKNYFFDIEKHKNMAFSNKLQHGFISQEVEKIFPELVVDGFAPNTSTDKKEDGKPIAYKGLNYVAFIPMLTKAIQE